MTLRDSDSSDSDDEFAANDRPKRTVSASAWSRRNLFILESESDSDGDDDERSRGGGLAEAAARNLKTTGLGDESDDDDDDDYETSPLSISPARKRRKHDREGKKSLQHASGNKMDSSPEDEDALLHERPVVTVCIVGTDTHLSQDLGEGVAVQLREIDGQFPDDHAVPVCRCIPTTISLTEDAVGQPVLSVSASRNEASFTTYGSKSSIEPWLSSEWGPMPVGVKRIFDAVERAETLLRSIQTRYPTADLPHVAKPDVNNLAARRLDWRALQVMYDRAMDQFYLLVTASKLLDRSVEAYHDRQVKHYWDEQDNARERAGVDAPGYEQGIPRPIFEFDALSTRATNSVQDEAKRDFLDNTAVGAYNILRAGGCVASHICYRATGPRTSTSTTRDSAPTTLLLKSTTSSCAASTGARARAAGVSGTSGGITRNGASRRRERTRSVTLPTLPRADSARQSGFSCRSSSASSVSRCR